MINNRLYRNWRPTPDRARPQQRSSVSVAQDGLTFSQPISSFATRQGGEACGLKGRHGASGLRGLRCASLSSIIYYLSFIISLISLTACSSDSDDEMMTTTETATKSVPVEVASYVMWFEENMGTNGVKGDDRTTRAWTVPTGYMAYEGGIQSIGIAFTQDGVDPAVGKGSPAKPMIGNFFFSNGKWRTSLEGIETEEDPYYLYGYIPYLPAIKYSITDYNGGSTAEEKNAEYSKGAIMKLENVPTVMSNDFCVVIGAKHGFDKEHDGEFDDKNSNKTYDEGTEDRTNRLRIGDFSVKGEKTSNEEPKNFIFLLFDHLYSALRIKMQVQKKYDDLRTIKLKTLLLSTQVGETISTLHSDITITLQSNTTETNPITSISYTSPSGDPVNDEGIAFWNAPTSEGVTLTTSLQEFTGHFMPSGINTLKLTSVYDVYDKEDNLLRENCRVTNTMELNQLFRQTEAGRGKLYIVNMTIQPTYLYMLSEPDLENPTVVMN